MSRSLSCGLALVSIVMLFIAIYALVIRPWFTRMEEYDRSAREAVSELARLQILKAQRPRLEQQLAEQEVRQQRSGYFIDASSSPALATSELIDRIKSIIKSHGGEVASFQALPLGGYNERLSARIHMCGDVNVLLKVLHQLEGGRALLFVKGLDVRVRHRNLARDSGGHNSTLDVRFEIVGFMGGEAG